MAELLKYFKHTQKKNKLDTDTLPDSGGPLSRDIPSYSIEVTNTHEDWAKCYRKHQVRGDHKGHIFH